jgi:hypothetical protein
MTATGGTSIRSLDPVDGSEPPPDGSDLLHALLATPRPTRVRRRGVRLLPLAPVGLALALLAGVVAVALSGGDGSGDEREVAAGAGGAAIVHSVVRERWGGPDGTAQLAYTYERWQLEDGSRGRTLSHWEAAGPLQGTTTEEVVTSAQTLTYLPATDQDAERIIRYRASDDFQSIPEQPPAFTAPPIGGSSEVGDPRRLPDRLARGDETVTQLADATVRDIAVEQFRVGDCRDATSAGRNRSADAVTTVPQRAIVALARDTLTPVRVTLEPCSSDGPPGFDTRILDYVRFEELAPTPENMQLLELSPHPGVPVVDGIEIDKAEERDEARPAPTVTPTPTPTATPDRP